MAFRTRPLAVTVLALAPLLLPFAAGAQGLPPPPPPPVPPEVASPSPGPSGGPNAVPSGAPATPEPGTTPPEAPQPGGPASPTPSGVPTGVPTPGTVPSGAQVPIRVDRARVQLTPGEAGVVHLSGGLGDIVSAPSFAGIQVMSDASGRTLTITAVANGRGTIAVSDAAGDTATISVLVAPPAGVVPVDVTVELAGTDSPSFVNARVGDAIAQVAQLQPGATVSVAPFATAPLHPGDVLDLPAHVALHGNDAFVDRSGTTSVHVHVTPLPQLNPVVLFYSDDPERLGTLDDGVLFRGAIDATRPARVYAYHVSDVPRRLYLVLTAPMGTSHVQILGAAAGPTDAFSYVGHVATVRYLLEHATQESIVETVLTAAPVVVPLGAGVMQPGQLIAATYDVKVLDGNSVDVMVVAAAVGVDPTTLLSQPEHPSDGHYRRGEFSLANVPPIALSYTAGAPEPDPFTVGVRYFANGTPAFPNLRSDINDAAGQRAPLAGDYGVLRNVSLQLANPTDAPQNVYLYEQPGANGGVTTTMWFDGDPAPTEIKCVSDPSQRYLVKGFGLAPGQTLSVTGTYMTDGTSFLPLTFGLTATQPPDAPPNGCGSSPNVTQSVASTAIDR